MPPTLPSARNSWSRYWAGGALTSLADAFRNNYQGAVRAGWEAFFSALPNGAHILDIGTGNGAVAALANAVNRAAGRDFEIHGIDAAPIDPLATVKQERELLAGIRFRGETLAEQTPFEDGYFHAVSGQYALEYSDERKTLPELVRILRPGGKARFVIHHPQSTVLRVAREEIVNAQRLFDSDFFSRARVLIEIVGAATTPRAREALKADPEAHRRREQFNDAAAEVSTVIQRSAHPEMLQIALDHVLRAYKAAQSTGVNAGTALLDTGWLEITASVGRLKDLVRATGDEHRAAHIATLAKEAGFDARPLEEMRYDAARLMGWVLALEKP